MNSKGKEINALSGGKSHGNDYFPMKQYRLNRLRMYVITTAFYILNATSRYLEQF